MRPAMHGPALRAASFRRDSGVAAGAALRRGRCLASRAAIRGEAWSPSPGACHDRYDASSVPARCDDTGPACRSVLPGPVLRAHPRAVRLPTPPLVRLVRDQRPRPAGRNPASTHRALHPIPRRVRGLWPPRSTPRCTPCVASSGSPTSTASSSRTQPSTHASPRSTATSPAPRAWTGSS
jgi:hypothetical protein